MRIKDLFTVSQNQRITERNLYQVLISSVCSILLCMSCLAGTTWAWFTVSIENTDNVIQIADLKANVSIKLGEEAVAESGNGGYCLSTGNTYSMNAEVTGGAKEIGLPGDVTAPAYVIMTVVKDSGTEIYYCTASFSIEVLKVSEDANVSFTVSWTQPVGENVFVLTGEPLTIGEELEEESSVLENEGTDGTTIPEEPSDTESVETTMTPPEETKASTIETETETPTTGTPTEEPSEPKTSTTEDNTELAETTQPAIEIE